MKSHNSKKKYISCGLFYCCSILGWEQFAVSIFQIKKNKRQPLDSIEEYTGIIQGQQKAYNKHVRSVCSPQAYKHYVFHFIDHRLAKLKAKYQ